MTQSVVTWPGTLAESNAFLEAVAHNCTCERDPESGARISTCPPHDALVHDQAFLNHLLFARRMLAAQLRAEEWEWEAA